MTDGGMFVYFLAGLRALEAQDAQLREMPRSKLDEATTDLIPHLH